MYKAIKEIGGYEIGDEVPTEKALVWLEMYDVPHVEKVDGESKKLSEEKKPETSKTSGDSMLEDYLGRNTNVVKKNVEDDDLSQEQIANLLELEKSNKKREVVIKALEKKLKKVGA